jgi:hypothetical protein
MRNEFQALRDKLMSCNIYDEINGDDVFNDVNALINNLGKKIDEVEKRIQCANRCASEINGVIGKFTEAIDKGEVVTINLAIHDAINQNANDVVNALDLNETMCIDDNWYGLFRPEVVFTFESSWGSIDCAIDGVVLKVHGDLEINGEHNYLFDILRVDIAEYSKFCADRGVTHGEALDILSVGFWKHDGTYAEHDKEWRKNVYGVEEEEVVEAKEEAPTELCKTPQTHEFVKDIIAKLKVIDVDGETMEYILEQVGMTDQMLRQLVMNNPYTDTTDILAEKVELDNQRVGASK